MGHNWRYEHLHTELRDYLGQNYIYHKDYDLRLIDEFRLYLDTVLILIYVLLLQLVIRI